MVVFKCKKCGGDLNIDQELSIAKCPYCESMMTLPDDLDEKKANVFNRANFHRMQGDFDRALAAYERILEDYGDDPEAHWGMALCRYGIEYVEDPGSSTRKPTCHRAQNDSILNDPDYKLSLKYANSNARITYEEEAERIDEIHRNILKISKDEKPFDVFICYKELDKLGSRTKDSVLAQEIYEALSAKGLRVFFSRITLESKLGVVYEPYIFAALNSAKVMIVVCFSQENAEAVWVKNEWSRFLSMMKKDKSKTLIPVFKDMNPNDLPDALGVLQAQDATKVGFMQDLVRASEKLAKSEPDENGKSPFRPKIRNFQEELNERAEANMAMGNYQGAQEDFRSMTTQYPDDPRGWWGKIRSYTRNFTILNNLAKTEEWYSFLLHCANGNLDQKVIDDYVNYRNKSQKVDRYKEIEKEIKEIKASAPIIESEISKAQEVFQSSGLYGKISQERERLNSITEYAQESSRKLVIMVIINIAVLILGAALSPGWFFLFILTIFPLISAASDFSPREKTDDEIVKITENIDRIEATINKEKSALDQLADKLAKSKNTLQALEHERKQLDGEMDSHQKASLATPPQQWL